MIFKLFLVSMFLCLLNCNRSDYDYVDPQNKCAWFLKNSTGNTVIVLKNFDSPNYNVVPNGNTITIYLAAVPNPEERDDHFGWTSDDMFSCILDAVVIEDSLKILNTNHVLLKTWTQYRRNDSGRQFFNEKYWEKREWEEGKYVYHEWTFELLPEDIKIKEPNE